MAYKGKIQSLMSSACRKYLPISPLSSPMDTMNEIGTKENLELHKPLPLGDKEPHYSWGVLGKGRNSGTKEQLCLLLLQSTAIL